MRGTIALELTDNAVERIANRVAQLLRTEVAEPRPLTAGQLARHLGVDRAWIYKHRHMLGGARLGDGPKAPWRFDLQTAKATLAHHGTAQARESDL